MSSGQSVCQSEGFCAAPWVDVGLGPAGYGILGAQAYSGFNLAGLLPNGALVDYQKNSKYEPQKGTTLAGLLSFAGRLGGLSGYGFVALDLRGIELLRTILTLRVQVPK